MAANVHWNGRGTLTVLPSREFQRLREREVHARLDAGKWRDCSGECIRRSLVFPYFVRDLRLGFLTSLRTLYRVVVSPGPGLGRVEAGVRPPALASLSGH